MKMFDLYYKVYEGDSIVTVTRSFESEYLLLREFHNSIKLLPNFAEVMGYEEREVELKPIPDYKADYSFFVKKP